MVRPGILFANPIHTLKSITNTKPCGRARGKGRGPRRRVYWGRGDRRKERKEGEGSGEKRLPLILFTLAEFLYAQKLLPLTK